MPYLSFLPDRRAPMFVGQAKRRAAHTSETVEYGPSKYMLPFPVEISLDIARRLPLKNVLDLSLTSSAMRAALIPVLYETVDLVSNEHCKKALGALSSAPHITRCIQHLKISPDAPGKFRRQVDEGWIAEMVQCMAGNDLSSLQSFAWEGWEAPKDSLWVALRESCPRLTGIYLTVDGKPLDPTSHLYDFVNLTSFTLIGRKPAQKRARKIARSAEILPDRLWDMLINQCPNLHTLIIKSMWNHPFTTHRITKGRWPKLTTLSLDWAPTSTKSLSGPVDPAFSSFLQAHDELRSLRLGWPEKGYSLSNAGSLSLPFSSLPRLSTFAGMHSHTASLPNPAAVSCLHLEDLYIDEHDLPLVSATLSKFPALSRLTIAINIKDTAQYRTVVFPALIAACPRLSYLNITSDPAFTGENLKALSLSLRDLPLLKKFVLTDWRPDKAAAMAPIAALICRGSPQLEEIQLIWVRARKTRQTGVYLPQSSGDSSAVPVSLDASETGDRLFRRPFSRSYSIPLK